VMRRGDISVLVRHKGISLIEVLVVLIILGLVSTIAMDGGSSAFIMKQKLEDVSQRVSTDSLVNSWFRTTIEGAYPLPEFPPTFTHSDIRLVTHSPLIDSRELKNIHWSLSVDGDYVVLQYGEDGDNFDVRKWFDAEAAFEYEFSDETHVFPKLVSLVVDYRVPSGRRKDEVIVLYQGRKTFPQDYRQVSN